ncbi:MAG: acetate kinase [Isosphaeraceae bacterium]|jgi:acetate kinase|nr:MAG: acetate kinase [Isosphaeraceae bacterium]
MDVLVLNAGSSSLKASVFAVEGTEVRELWGGQVEGIGTGRAAARFREAGRNRPIADYAWPAGGGPEDHVAAVGLVVEGLAQWRPGFVPGAIGHRVVHGGMRYAEPVLVTPEVRRYLESIGRLSPLHGPANLAGIDAAVEAYPGVPQVACFDTAFHRRKPWECDTYALPRRFYAEGIRRYGFHGISYESVIWRLKREEPELVRGRLVVAHLGNGASLCAIRDGRSVETTMGFTPTDGVPMGTRCGQIDPGVLTYLIREGWTAERLEGLLNRESGLKGLSGISGDMRDLLASGAAEAREAIGYFVHRVAGTVGYLAVALGGMDGLVFTAGIGENAAKVRAAICERLAWLGLRLDAERNAAHGPLISAEGSAIKVLVVPTDEERMIATQTERVVGSGSEITGGQAGEPFTSEG